MAENLVGYERLRARIAAITPGHALGHGIMGTLAMAAKQQAGNLAPHKTGNLRRSIDVRDVTDTSARIVASADYASDVEFGTKPHVITPKQAKALRWAASPAGRRLTGTPTKAAQRGGAGGLVFAKRVNHPGTKAKPFLKPGAEKAIEGAGLADMIVSAWNKA